MAATSGEYIGGGSMTLPLGSGREKRVSAGGAEGKMPVDAVREDLEMANKVFDGLLLFPI